MILHHKKMALPLKKMILSRKKIRTYNEKVEMYHEKNRRRCYDNNISLNKELKKNINY
jgi:hypothetical protein